jgi:hypothetical protein
MEHPLPSRAAAACSEFPNDNPALHRGAIWCCLDLGAEAVCLVAVPPVEILTTGSNQAQVVAADQRSEGADAGAVDAGEPAEPTPTEPIAVAAAVGEAAEAQDADEIEVEIQDEIALSEVILEEPHAEVGRVEETATTSDDAFVRLGDVLEATARAAGCGGEAIRCLRALLGFERIDPEGWDRAGVEALLAAGLLERGEHGFLRSEGFARQVLGWQGVLRGESEDFDACGTAMLDEWCAALLARIAGNPSRTESLRRELRRRGVAAFGLVADAA